MRTLLAILLMALMTTGVAETAGPCNRPTLKDQVDEARIFLADALDVKDQKSIRYWFERRIDLWHQEDACRF